MSSTNVTISSPGSPTRSTTIPKPPSTTTAASSSSEAKKTTGPMDKFVRPVLKRQVSVLDSTCESSSSPLPKDKKRKLDPRILSSTYGMIFYRNKFNAKADERFYKMIDAKAEKAVGFLATANDLLKSNLKTPSKPIQAPPLQIKPKEEVSARRIDTTPFHTLSAPRLDNDFYTNVIDWSSRDLLAIALADAVHLYNGRTGRAFPLDYTFDCTIGAVAFDPKSVYLAVGTKNNMVHFFDVKKKKLLKALRYPAKDGHINAIAWHPARKIVSVGTSEGCIYHFNDVLEKTHGTLRVQAHCGDVCGLKWHPDGSLLASGGNDTHVRIWRAQSLAHASYDKQHRSAVKALAWCPWNPHLLASGGGRDDKKIHVWNLKEYTRVKTFDAGSQVTSLHWSKHYRELVSTHGMPHPHICIWDYTTTKKKVDIPAHEDRILHSAINPSMEKLVTLSNDKKMKFWDIFTAHGTNPLPDESLSREEARKRFIKEAQEEVR